MLTYPLPTVDVARTSLEDLEWHRVVAALSRRAESEPGRQAALTTEILTEPEAIRYRLELVQQMQQVLDTDRFISLGDLSDSAMLVAKTEKDGVLDADELRHIATLTEYSVNWSGLGNSSAETLPVLSAMLSELSPLHELAAQFRKVLDERGEVRDDASGLLKDIRKRKRGLAGRIKSRIHEYLTKHDLKNMLMDTYYTIREERYVLPVKAQEKRHIPGIIHGSSQTGQTVFIEPQELIDFNNDLKMLESEEQQEIRRILRELSRTISYHADQLRANQDILAEADRLAAAARLSDELNAHVPVIAEGTSPGFRFMAAAHPLLLLRGVRVVRNELRLGRDEYNTLVVSGPNTGGKTVCLKTAGILVLMAQAGLPIPAGSDSELVPYSSLWCDIGDEQNLEEDLSTFSGNLKNLNHMVAEARAGSLLLLDEIIVGTDPLQGSALAVSYLEAFNSKQAQVIVTTHYEQVKLAAQASEGFANAAVGLNPDTGHPNFILTIGVPGTSSALQVASDLGTDPAILTRAEELLSGGPTGGIEDIVRDLNTKINELEAERLLVQARLEETEREAARLQERHEKLQKGWSDLNSQKHTAQRKAYLEAQEEVKTILRKVQREQVSVDEVRQTQQELQKREAAIPRPEAPKEPAKNLPFSDPVAVTSATPGMEVWVKGYGRMGVVLEASDRNRDVLVEVGRIKSRVSVKELLVSKSGLSGGNGKKQKQETGYSVQRAPEADDQVMTLDLRGMRGDEAISELERFLDRSFGRMEQVSVLHGHGTGALKRMVREFLLNCGYVKRSYPADAEHGGDAYTIVELK